MIQQESVQAKSMIYEFQLMYYITLSTHEFTRLLQLMLLKLKIWLAWLIKYLCNKNTNL